jgi:hypothetical protein
MAMSSTTPLHGKVTVSSTLNIAPSPSLMALAIQHTTLYGRSLWQQPLAVRCVIDACADFTAADMCVVIAFAGYIRHNYRGGPGDAVRCPCHSKNQAHWRV